MAARARFDPSMKRGFTLLELLVAATVGVLVAGGALAVVDNALAWQERTAGRGQASAAANRVLDQVAADLQAACRRDGAGIGLAATILDGAVNSGLWEPGSRQKPPGAVMVGGDDIAVMRFGVGGVWLRFFAQVPDAAAIDESKAALPRAVAYQIIRRRPPGITVAAPARYVLHRSVVRAAEAAGRPGSWESGWDLDPAADANYTDPAAVNDGAVTGDPYSVVRPAAAENLLAIDVVDFGVRLLARDAGGTRQVLFPLESGPAVHLARVNAPAGLPAERYPEAVEVLVRVMTPDGARRLAAFEAVTPGEDDSAGWWELVLAQSEVVTRLIHLPGGAR
jgi:prepilin-type N-terminal cleavage/methylation domain-containing protein